MKRCGSLLAGVSLLALLGCTGLAKADTFLYSSASVFQGTNIQIFSPHLVGADTGMIQLTGFAQRWRGRDRQCVVRRRIFDVLQASGLYNIVPLTTAGVGGSNPTLTRPRRSTPWAR